MRTINVPVDMIRRIRWNKGSLEMLVCAIMIKRKYQNSTLYDLRVTNVMKFFGVSHKKALKLMAAFKESEFFIYNPVKDCLFAKTLKSGNQYVYGNRKKYIAFADYCRKMQLQDTIKLREVVRELRNILAICEINATAFQRNNLNVGDNTSKLNVAKPRLQSVIPHAKLGYTMGFSRSSACRYIKRLVDEKRVGKSGIVAECVISSLSVESEREYREHHPDVKFVVWHDAKYGGYSAWVIYGNSYFVSNRKDSDAFQHVIYNYRRGAEYEAKTSSELDGDRAWSRY